MDLDFWILRAVMRQWRLIALLVLLFVPGAMALFFGVISDRYQAKADRIVEHFQERMDELGTPAPTVAPPAP